MIRHFNLNDIEEVNILLSIFNYKIDENILNHEFTKIILYEEKYIKGILIYSLIYDRIEIEYIVVEEKSRRCGIAKKLLNYLNNYENIKNITLEVRENNKSAIKFYENNGFEIVTIRKNYYKDEDGILMLKRISD